jgi:hypothetical protein
MQCARHSLDFYFYLSTGQVVPCQSPPLAYNPQIIDKRESREEVLVVLKLVLRLHFYRLELHSYRLSSVVRSSSIST